MEISKKLALSLVIGLLVSFVIAQPVDNQSDRQGGRMGGPGGQMGFFDPARMTEMIITRSTTGIPMTAEESKVIVPKIKVLMDLRFNSPRELQTYRDALSEALKQTGNDKAVKLALDKFKAKCQEIKKKTDAAEADLKSVLTIRQEAELSIRGIISNGVPMGGGMGMGARPNAWNRDNRSGNRMGPNNNN